MAVIFPFLYGFATFDSYMNTVENNKLVEREQKTSSRKRINIQAFVL